MEFINLTAHDINIITEDKIVVIEPSGSIARVDVTMEDVGVLDGIPVKRNTYGSITGLPEPKEGRYYIVSVLVAQVAKRDDVLVTNDAVRDDKGRIIGCRSLARI